MYQASSPSYFRYLYEINPNSPSQTIKTHLLGTRVAMGSSSTMPSGLYVDLPRVVTNEYQSSEGYHNYFTESGTNFVKQGKNQIKGAVIMEWMEWRTTHSVSNVTTMDIAVQHKGT